MPSVDREGGRLRYLTWGGPGCVVITDAGGISVAESVEIRDEHSVVVAEIAADNNGLIIATEATLVVES